MKIHFEQLTQESAPSLMTHGEHGAQSLRKVAVALVVHTDGTIALLNPAEVERREISHEEAFEHPKTVVNAFSMNVVRLANGCYMVNINGKWVCYCPVGQTCSV